MKYFLIKNVEEATKENQNFREVIFTGKHSQFVLMSLKPGEEIGREVHEHVDQFFRVEQGEGKLCVGDDEEKIEDGSAFLIVAGTEHNVVNTGEGELKLYTLYSPANHLDGRIHVTKEDALKDKEDEEFGHKN